MNSSADSFPVCGSTSPQASLKVIDEVATLTALATRRLHCVRFPVTLQRAPPPRRPCGEQWRRRGEVGWWLADRPESQAWPLWPSPATLLSHLGQLLRLRRRVLEGRRPPVSGGTVKFISINSFSSPIHFFASPQPRLRPTIQMDPTATDPKA